MALEGIPWHRGYQRPPINQAKEKARHRVSESEMIAYLIPVQQETIHESPNDTGARRNLDLLLHRRNLRLVPRGDRVAERNGPLLVQVVVRGVIIWDAPDALDGAQDGA